jgi:hypothetical protein
LVQGSRNLVVVAPSVEIVMIEDPIRSLWKRTTFRIGDSPAVDAEVG